MTVGADARIGIGDVVNLDVWGAHTETPSRPGASNAINFAGSYATRNWELGLAARQVDEDFNPEVGYLERPTFRYYTVRVLRHLRTPNLSWFREVRPHVTFRQYDDTQGRPQSRLVHIDDHFLFANGAFFEFPGLNFIREALQTPFAISDKVTLQPGIYDWFEFESNFNTNLSAPYSVTGTFTAGGFYTGHHASLASTWTARPNRKLLAAFRMGYEAVRLKEGDFNRVLLGFRLAYSFTPQHLPPVAHPVQQSVEEPVVQRALRLAGTGGDGVVPGVQRGPGDRRKRPAIGPGVPGEIHQTAGSGEVGRLFSGAP